MEEYKPTLGFVHVPMLAVIFSVLILLWYFVFRKSPVFARFMGNQVFAGAAPPGSTNNNYLDYSGWYAGQYQANGAEAGYKTSVAKMYVPYNETGITY